MCGLQHMTMQLLVRPNSVGKNECCIQNMDSDNSRCKGGGRGPTSSGGLRHSHYRLLIVTRNLNPFNEIRKQPVGP
jgi:hypothetical protein